LMIEGIPSNLLKKPEPSDSINRQSSIVNPKPFIQMQNQ
jgi:hypothetical protein